MVFPAQTETFDPPRQGLRPAARRGKFLDPDAAPATVLMVHNEYQQPGGEDEVFAQESALLETRGHRVIRYRAHNERVSTMGRGALARDTFWNHAVYREIRAVIRRERPRLVHFHNTFPLVSPAGYYAAASEGIPTVQTLHNYRLLCPNGLFFRDGHPCEDCLNKLVPWPGVVHGCYRESIAATGLVAAMLSAHRVIGTWKHEVGEYIALTEFARRKFVDGGLPADRITVKPNFVSRDAGVGAGSGGYALYVGRLSAEKGVGTLLSAWRSARDGIMPLKVVGDGPLAEAVARTSKENPRVSRLGRKTPEEVRSLMKEAAILVVPSEWYETFGRVVAESFAAGTPVVAAKVGAIAELVEHGRTGLYFRSTDQEDLVRQVQRLSARPAELAQMRQNARAEFEEKYTAGHNYRLLCGIYEKAAERTRT